MGRMLAKRCSSLSLSTFSFYPELLSVLCIDFSFTVSRGICELKFKIQNPVPVEL